MKKLLIITYYWPPSGGAGVQRTLKFVKYLPSYGIEPVVITVDPEKATYPAIDPSLLNETKNVKVYHTSSFEALQVLARFAGKKSIPHSGFANKSKEGYFQKVLRFIRGNFFIPDARIGWNKYAYKKAVEVIENEKIDAVLISSPPHSSQLIGLKLKKRFPKLKWIADMRDPWTDIYYYPELLHTKPAASKDASLEKNVLESADEVIVVSDPIRELFLSKGSNLSPEKFHVIPNGFDETDFNFSIDRPDTFTITYVGTLAESYEPDVFFDAFSLLLENNKGKAIQLVLVGTLPGSIAERVNVIRQNFPNAITFIPYVDHDKAVKYMKQADVLLLIIPHVKNNEGILTGKLFEYLGAGGKILGIGPEKGAASKIIEGCSAGRMFDRSKRTEILAFLQAAMNREGAEQGNPERRLEYSRRKLAGRLSKLI